MHRSGVAATVLLLLAGCAPAGPREATDAEIRLILDDLESEREEALCSRYEGAPARARAIARELFLQDGAVLVGEIPDEGLVVAEGRDWRAKTWIREQDGGVVPVLYLKRPALDVDALRLAQEHWHRRFAERSAGDAWRGRLRTWGTLREVMRDGRTEGRIDLSRLDAGPETVGIGALAGLRGEVLVLDGRVHLATARPSASRGPADGDEAAFLALADVPGWTRRTIDTDLDLAALERVVDEAAAGVETLPFVIDGDFVPLDGHVLDGRCPFAAREDLRGEPARSHRDRARGSLVGFFTRLPAGSLAHHGTRLHVHALIDDGDWSGHVDAATISAGATLRLPRLAP